MRQRENRLLTYTVSFMEIGSSSTMWRMKYYRSLRSSQQPPDSGDLGAESFAEVVEHLSNIVSLIATEKRLTQCFVDVEFPGWLQIGPIDTRSLEEWRAFVRDTFSNGIEHKAGLRVCANSGRCGAIVLQKKQPVSFVYATRNQLYLHYVDIRSYLDGRYRSSENWLPHIDQWATKVFKLQRGHVQLPRSDVFAAKSAALRFRLPFPVPISGAE
jgi:hypothetical protein